MEVFKNTFSKSEGDSKGYQVSYLRKNNITCLKNQVRTRLCSLKARISTEAFIFIFKLGGSV